MHTLLVPFDGSKHAQKALHIASDLAEKYECAIHVFYVIPQSLQDEASAPREAKALLKRAQQKLSARGIVKVSTEFEIGDPAEAILIAVRRLNASTIVMGCRGERDDQLSQFGSVSQAIFQRAGCTCISVK